MEKKGLWTLSERYLPNILAATLVLWVGFFIARLVRELLVPVFDRLKVDTLQTRAGIQVSDTGRLSNTLAALVIIIIGCTVAKFAGNIVESLIACYICDGLANKALLKGNHTVFAMVSKIEAGPLQKKS